MKKKIQFTFLLIMMLLIAAPAAYAETDSDYTEAETIYYDDGSYEIIETTVEPSLTRASTVPASSTSTYYSSSNVKQWTFTLKATFAYNGSTAKALSDDTSKTLSNGWSCSSNSSSRSGNSATGKATFKKNTATKSSTIKLTCSPSGKVTAKKS